MSKQPWRLLKPMNLLVLAVVLFLAVILVILPLVKIASYPLISSYQQGQCTITSKELQTFGGSSDGDPMFLAHFEYTVRTASGAQAHGNRYDWFDGAGWIGGPFETGSTDRAGEQTVLDHYTVGSTYACWYDPRTPSQAVLTRDVEWGRLISANPLFAVIALVAAFIIFATVLIVLASVVSLARQGVRSAQGKPQGGRTADERRERAKQSLDRLQGILSKRDPSE